MKLIRKTYDWVLNKSDHPHAPRFLALISFIESSVFPIPPDVLLIPMCLGSRQKSWGYALIATTASVLGGALGYLIGYSFYEAIGLKVIEFYHLQTAFEQLQGYFQVYGIWFVIVAGFTPIPYKVFSIGAGVFQMAFWPFCLASVIGRGARFFLLSALIFWIGPQVKDLIDKYFNIAVMLFSVLLIGSFLLLKYI
jgi:membrane protein YqaA with SNARE-associated domain